MATSVQALDRREHYLNAELGIKSWLFTIDHKRIGLLFLAGVTLFFFLGGFFALLIRLELLTPAGDLVISDTYHNMFTMHRMRAPGLTWSRLPLFCWSMYATSVMFVLATPVLAITLLLVGVERLFHIGFFDPTFGGDPLLFQHLFWFYSHPAVYIMILPAMGVVSEVVTCFSRKRVFGYSFVAGSSIMIALL